MAQVKLADGRYAELLATVADVPTGSWVYVAPAGGVVNTTVAATLVAATAGVRNVLNSIQVSTDALGAATEFVIRDGAAGAVLFRMKLGTAAVMNAAQNFNPPLRGTVGNLLEYATLTASVTGGVFVNAQGAQGL